MTAMTGGGGSYTGGCWRLWLGWGFRLENGGWLKGDRGGREKGVPKKKKAKQSKGGVFCCKGGSTEKNMQGKGTRHCRTGSQTRVLGKKYLRRGKTKSRFGTRVYRSVAGDNENFMGDGNIGKG